VKVAGATIAASEEMLNDGTFEWLSSMASLKRMSELLS